MLFSVEKKLYSVKGILINNNEILKFMSLKLFFKYWGGGQSWVTFLLNYTMKGFSQVNESNTYERDVNAFRLSWGVLNSCHFDILGKCGHNFCNFDSYQI